MKQGLLFFFICWIYIAKGISYYVSPSGDDFNKGTRWVIPFKTLQKAANVAQAGDTVFILKGNYSSESESLLYITRSGKANAWIVYMNYLNHKPVLKVKNKFGIRIQSANFICIEGLSITSEHEGRVTKDTNQRTGIFIDGSFEAACNHIKIYNNFIYKMNGSGLAAQYFDYLTISFNKFFENSTASESFGGIYLKSAVDIDGRAVYHNFIQGNVMQKNGMIIDSNSQNCPPAIYFNYDLNHLNSVKSKTLVHNNIIYTNGGGGIRANSCLGFDIINNTLYKNSELIECRKPEIEIINSSVFNVFNNIIVSSPAKPGNLILHSADIRFQNNLYYNFSSRVPGENDLIANPEFELINEKEGLYNFRLKGNSPAINSGIDELLSDIDYEGNARKIDTHVDLGALEFTNRILPSLKNTKAGPQSKGIQSYWTSLYTKDQKIYTIWNQQNRSFSIRVFNGQGVLVLEKIRTDPDESSFEIDFNVFLPDFYTILAYNSLSRNIERIQVQTRPSTP